MKTSLRILLVVLLVGAAVWIGWPSSSTKAPIASTSKAKPERAVTNSLPITPPSSDMATVPPAATPLTLIIPASVVQVPQSHPMAPPAVREFRDWAEKYFRAKPEQQPKLIEEGTKLAMAHQKAIGQLIPEDPKLAIENAVPMVVRQSLPEEIVSKLEKRVNTTGSLTRYGAVPVEGEPTSKNPMSYSFVAQDAPVGEAMTAYVYGSRSADWWLKETKVNGISAEGVLAIADLRVRQLEVGEQFDPKKPVIEVCPVSGTETPLPAATPNAPRVASADTTVVEDNRRVIVMCAGGHITRYSSQLAYEEGRGTQYMAEGAAGGGFKPFNVNTAKTESLLYLRIAFPDIMQEPRTEADVYDTLRRVTDYFATSSFGRYFLTPTVTPLIVLPYPEQWYIASRNSAGKPNGYGLLQDHAFEAARRLGYDKSSYDLDVCDYKGGPHTTEDGGSFGGLGGGRSVWLYNQSTGGGLDGVLSHELGHTFGLS
ncbi:MAG: hypothetical protein K8R87_05670, partial [Verrucomicrobia bacterium]|nr:hypothetical protein [Verrucomicrobiota bacterium]